MPNDFSNRNTLGNLKILEIQKNGKVACQKILGIGVTNLNILNVGPYLSKKHELEIWRFQFKDIEPLGDIFIFNERNLHL